MLRLQGHSDPSESILGDRAAAAEHWAFRTLVVALSSKRVADFCFSVAFHADPQHVADLIVLALKARGRPDVPRRPDEPTP